MKRFVSALAALGLVACGGGAIQEETGAAAVAVRASNIYSGEVSTVVEVTIKKGAEAGDTHVLAPNGTDAWVGTFDRLTPGQYQFCASGRDSARVYSAPCVTVRIEKNKMADVRIRLQQVGGQTTIDTDSPLITGISLSDGAPAYGQSIEMSAAVTSKTASSFTYEWTASCSGASTDIRRIADGDHATATFTSDCTATEVITLKVTDPTRAISSVVSFSLRFYPQGANVTVQLNTWPDITTLSSPDAQLEPGASTTIALAASDVDGDSLTHEWESTCGTVEGNATGASFTAPSTVGDCTVKVTVSDGFGGSVSGSIIVHVAYPVRTTTMYVQNALPNGAGEIVPDTSACVEGGSFGPRPSCPESAVAYGSITPMTMFGHSIQLGDIKSMSYETNKAFPLYGPDNSWVQDWALVMHVGGLRLGAEPYYTSNRVDPANAWNTWTTSVAGPNTLRFYDVTSSGGYGSYGDPTFDVFVTGAAYNGTPYAVLGVDDFGFLANDWWQHVYTGVLRNFRIELKNGEVAVVNFAPMP